MDISQNLFLASFEDSCVLLDLERDRYIGLGRRLSKAALQLAHPGSTTKDAQQLAIARETLRAKGIQIADNEALTEVGTDQSAIPDKTLWPSRRFTDRFPPFHEYLAPLSSLCLISRLLNHRALKSTILRMHHEKVAKKSVQPTHELQYLLDVFYAARPWFPANPVCRLDALALSLYLWRSGYNAQLVFGVRQRPFSAHCWVQHFNVAINEAYSPVDCYTPIMCI